MQLASLIRPIEESQGTSINDCVERVAYGRRCNDQVHSWNQKRGTKLNQNIPKKSSQRSDSSDSISMLEDCTRLAIAGAAFCWLVALRKLVRCIPYLDYYRSKGSKNRVTSTLCYMYTKSHIQIHGWKGKKWLHSLPILDFEPNTLWIHLRPHSTHKSILRSRPLHSKGRCCNHNMKRYWPLGDSRPRGHWSYNPRV